MWWTRNPLGKGRPSRGLRHRRPTAQRQRGGRPQNGRTLRVEPLEDRCLLSSSWPGLLIHDSSGDIFTVDFRGGWNLNRVGNTPVRMFDMAFSASGELYAVGGPTGASSQLYRLSVNYTSYSPVDMQLVGAIRVGSAGVYVNSVDFGPDGFLYAAGYDAAGVNTLFRVDPGTAAATAVMLLGPHRSAGDLEFDEFGNLYFTTENARLVRVDLTNGTYQEVGWVVFNDFFGLSYGPGPVLHGFRSNGEVYRINTQTGSITFVTRLSHSYLDSVYGAAMIYPGPLNLGEVDFVHRPSEPIVLQEMWYRVQTVRDAIFTVETYGGSSGTKVTLYRPQPDGTLAEVADVYRRVDYAVSGPSTFYVQISRTGTVLNVRMANLYKPAGNGAIIFGTNGDDTFQFQAGTTYVMTINGLAYSSSFDSKQLVEVSFQGGEGTDQVIFSGGTRSETVTFNLPTKSGELRSSKYLVQATEAERFSYSGGGGLDSATIIGTSADEQITLSYRAASIVGPERSAEVTATATIDLDGGDGTDSVVFSGTVRDEQVVIAPGDASFGDSEGAYNIRVRNAEIFDLDGRGGIDSLTLVGGPGADFFEIRWDRLSATGAAYQLVAAGFEDITVQGTPGYNDNVKMYSKGGWLDTFYLEPGEVRVEGDGRRWTAHQVDRIEVFGNSYENDVAYLQGYPATPATLTATSTYATLSGSGFYLRAASVRQVYVLGNASSQARFYDGPGNDRLMGTSSVARLIFAENSDHFVQAENFGQVTFYATTANGGQDRAELVGLNGARDTFYARPREVTFFGPGYRYWLVDVESTLATGQAADGDIAYLLDSDGSDAFYYYPTPGSPEQQTRMTGTTAGGWSYSNAIAGFASVYPYSTRGGLDTAYLYDSSAGSDTLTATPEYVALSGPGHFVRVWGFPRVFAFAGGDGFANTARLYSSTGSDIFEAGPTSARILFGGSPLHVVTVSGFRYTTAFSQGGTHQARFYGNPGTDDRLTAWLDNRTVVREWPGVYYRTVGFSQVYAYGDYGDGDRAIVYDSVGNDHLQANGLVQRNRATITGGGMTLDLIGFAHVRAESSRGGTDTRAVYHRALLDFVLEDVGNWLDI